jgi:hypothetical protein
MTVGQKYKIVWGLCIFSASEVIHCVVDTDNFSEKEVKNADHYMWPAMP